MQATDILFSIGLILVLAGVFYLLLRSEGKTKNKHKMTAYNLLEEQNPEPEKIKETIINDINSEEVLYPPVNLIFNAFNKTPFDKVKVVII